MARIRVSRRWEAAVIAGILLLALGLRLYHLDAQSLWNDEGTSVALAQRDLATIARHASYDIHPPLYYIILHGWVALAGTSEIAVRSLSVVAGVALVAGVWALARRLVGPFVAALAALLAAVAPFQVYYAQEARMYIWAALFGLLATLAFERLLTEEADGGARPRLAWRIAYVLTAVATVYSHYVGATVLLAHNLAYVAWWVAQWRAHPRGGEPGSLAPAGRGWGRGEPWRALGGWALLQGLIALAYVPWLAVSWRSLRNWPAVSAGFSVGAMLGDALRVLVWGPAAEAWRGVTAVAQGISALALPGLLAALGRASAPASASQHEAADPSPRESGVGATGRSPLRRRPERKRGASTHRKQGSAPCMAPCARDGGVGASESVIRHSPARWFGALTLLLYAVTPIALMALASLGRPMYKTKFVLLATPPFYVLVAAGVVAAGQWVARLSRRRVAGVAVAGLLALGALAPAARGLARLYWDPTTYRDDYRGIAAYITATAGPNDAILINAPAQIETLNYYYRGPLPEYPLPRQRPIEAADARAELEAMSARHDRIYAVLWATNESDPERVIEGWLDARAFKAMDSWFGNVRLAMYALPRSSEGAEVVPEGHVLGGPAGGQVRLRGYSVLTPEPAGGDVLQVALHWEALAPIATRYKVFVHLVDSRGNIVAQRDSEPGGGMRLTGDWAPGEAVADLYGLLIPPGTPPGEHVLRVGMYGLDDGRRLAVSLEGQAMGDAIDLARVTVAWPASPPPEGALDRQHRHDVAWGGLGLVGHSLHRLGHEHEAALDLRPGDVARLVLYWRREPGEAPGSEVVVSLGDRAGRVVWEATLAITGGDQDPATWGPGELVRDVHALPLPADVAPGTYRLGVRPEGTRVRPESTRVKPVGEAKPYTLQTVTLGK